MARRAQKGRFSSKSGWTGQGLSFNPGARVEGLTNLAWGVVLAPFAGGDALLAGRVLAMGCLLATLGLLARWASRNRLGLVAGLVATLPVVLLPWAPYWAMRAMETAAVTLLVTLAWTRYEPEATGEARLPLAALGLGLAPAFRPDAALLAPLLGLWHLARPQGRWTRMAAISASLVLGLGLGLVALKLTWYGHVLPVTFEAKKPEWPLHTGRQYLASFLLVPWKGFGVLSVGAVAWSLWGRRARALPALVVLLWAGIAVGSNGDFFPNFRFLVPALPALGACFAQGVHGLGRRLPRAGAALGLGLALLATAPLASVYEVRTWGQGAEDTPGWGVTSKDTAFPTPWSSPEWSRGLREQWPFPTAWVLVHARDEDRVAFTDIGLFSFVNDVVVVDLLGLTDPFFALHPIAAGRHDENTEQRRYLARNVDLLVVKHDVRRWRVLVGWLQEDGWLEIAGCGTERVLAAPGTSDRAAPAPDLRTRIEHLLARAPEHTGLHFAVLRELSHVSADPALSAWALDRMREVAPPSQQPNLHDVACEAGLGLDCPPATDRCGGAMGADRDLSPAVPETRPRRRPRR